MKQNLIDIISEYLLLAAAVILTVVHIGYVSFYPRLMHDVALYVSMGQRVANGAIPYVDVVDTNPPMILYISTIPALISKFFGTPLTITALIFFMGLIFILGLGFLYALKIVNPGISRSALMLAWIFWVWMSLWVYTLGLYAQREHFIFLLMAGFIVIRCGRFAGIEIKPVPAIPFGILAAMGIGMKPHYLLPWLGVELLLLGIYRRDDISRLTKNVTQSAHTFRNSILPLAKSWFAPEITALSISGFLYLGHFFVVPGMSSYYTYWIPLFARGYKVFDTGWSELLSPGFFTPLLNFWPITLLALATVFALKREKRLALPALPLAFVVISILTLSVYIFQKKGWLYQGIGFHLGLIAAVGLTLVDGLQKIVSKQAKILLTTGFVALLILANKSMATSVVQKFVNARETWLQTPSEPYTVLLNHLTQPDESVMFLTTTVSNVFPAITYSGRINANRFGMAVPLAIILSNANKSGVSPEWQADEKIYYGGVLADIKKFSPRAVMISGSHEGIANVSILHYFQRKGLFETSLVNYTCVGKIDDFVVYLHLPDPKDSSYSYYHKSVLFLYNNRILASFPPDCGLE